MGLLITGFRFIAACQHSLTDGFPVLAGFITAKRPVNVRYITFLKKTTRFAADFLPTGKILCFTCISLVEIRFHIMKFKVGFILI